MKKGIDYIGVAVVTMCHDGNGRYLMGLRSDQCRDEHNLWDSVGNGGVEHGETFEEAIRREVKEECGADVVKIEYLGYREVFREMNGKCTHWLPFDFKVEIKPEQATITEPDMCLEQRWCTIDEIPEPRHSQFPSFLEKYKDKL